MKTRNGLAVLELLLAMFIIVLLFYFVSKIYFRKPALDEKTQQLLSEQGISTGTYQGMVKSAEEGVKNYNKAEEERQKKIEGQLP